MAEEVEAIRTLYGACKNGKPLEKYTIANFGGQRGSPDKLNLTTIHSAKGLEYDVVIMMGLEDGRIPYYKSSESQISKAKIKEARRLFYVAMTRARHAVYLLWSGWHYNNRGGKSNNGRSRFVSEVMEKLAGA
jgi:DNA helicase-2/ATP-dependent DNA helicase PcrA